MSERVTLTEAEREALRDWWDSEPPECTTGMLARLDATVERILADRLAAATADYERRLDHAHDNHLRQRAALAAEPTWVCDTCMLRVHRDQIAVWADGEHVVCQWCRQAEVEALRATVARVESLLTNIERLERDDTDPRDVPRHLGYQWAAGQLRLALRSDS